MTLLAAGQLIDARYELTQRIAVGGMGEVWEAADTRLGRSVAVKILRPELSGDDEFVQRFRIEARTVASLDHPGIAHVHDYGEDSDADGRRTAYLVMELVRGEPLSALVARGPLDVDETLRIVEHAAWALHAAHERGFVHRDVKPGNILVAGDGRVKLTDFGIAKAANAVPVTRSGMVMGTAHYIAPEQATGGEAGPTGDVYSLGIVGYECLTGQRPFRGDNAVDVAAMQVRNAPPPLPAAVPAHVRELIESVLVKDPTQRYATGAEFAQAVAAVRRGERAPAPGAATAEDDGADDGAVTSRSVLPRRRRRKARGAVDPVVATPPEPAPAGHRKPAPGTPPGSFTPPAATDESVSASASVRPYTPPVADRPAAAIPPSGAPRPLGGTADASVRPRNRAAHAAPLNVTPSSSAGSVALFVLFVLLTVAAVVVGYLVFVRGIATPVDTAPNRPTSGASAGSVAGREDVAAGRTATEAPLVAMLVRRVVR